MKSRWITYEGKRIFYCDCSDFKLSDFEQLKAELDDVESLLSQEPESSVLVLTDTCRSVASPSVVELFKDRSTTTAKYIGRQAVIGVTGIKKILFDAVVKISGQHARAFGDLELEEAKKWLVEGD